MILGVLSDTHQNHVLMYKAADMLVERLGASHLIHLGDNWEDKEDLERLGYSVSGVPGLWCPAYHDRHIPRVRVDEFDGVRIACAHDIQTLRTMAAGAVLLLSGHTHRPNIETRHGVVYMNPGHLKNRVDRGQEATCGLVRIQEESLLLGIYGLDGRARQTCLFPLEQKNKELPHDHVAGI